VLFKQDDKRSDSRISARTLRVATRLALYGGSYAAAGILATGAISASEDLVAAPFPPVIELSALDGSDGFVLEGIDENDYTGIAVSNAGDVNGDGIDDVVIGANRGDPGPVPTNAGEVYVVFGRPDLGAGGRIELAELDGTNGFTIPGLGIQAFTGSEVGSGDINGDGRSDLLIGAGNAEPNGKVYVVFGRPGLGSSGQFNLATLNGSNGFAVIGIDSEDNTGTEVDAGDVNGDGIDDLITGANDADPHGADSAGEAYVVFGHPAQFPASFMLERLLPSGGGDGSEGLVLEGIDSYDSSAEAASFAGDVNGDGYGDILIGAEAADPNGVDRAGESYIVFGGADVGGTGLLSLADLDGSNGFVLNGIDFLDLSGSAVSAARDVNVDGINDFLIGANHASPEGRAYAGEAYVVFGGDELGAGGAVGLASLDGGNGFTLWGAEINDRTGFAVGAAGDVNGDGIEDVAIGAIAALDYAGRAYVVFGRPGLGENGFFDLATVDGNNGFAMNGVAHLDSVGISVSGAGDINADGVDDVIVGADEVDPDGVHDAGAAYIVFGRAAPDSDGDGIADSGDNCTLLANADQRDTDSDGFGNVCDPDLDNSGSVNFTDLGLLKAVFFGADPDADFDGDGQVSFTDLGTMNAFFFQRPGPSGLVR
jgi:hypothetical protein